MVDEVKKEREELMKKRFLTMCLLAVAGVVAGVVVLYGCGGGGIGTDFPDGYTRISIRGSATSGSAVMNDLGVFLAISDPFKDASDGTDGTGTGGPESIYDTAASTCLFSGESESNDGWIDIKWGNATTPATVADCTDENICIYCNVNDAAANSCTIACDGLVPSNSYSAADYFKIYLTAYHAFETEMPDELHGMVRIDGDATSLDSETLLSASVDDEGTDARVYANCENGVTGGDPLDKVTTDTTAGSGMSLNTHTAGVWAIGYDITALDLLVGEVGTSTCGVGHDEACVIGGCHITDKLTIIAAMTGSDTPGASLDMAFSEINMTATICDTEDVCAIHVF